MKRRVLRPQIENVLSGITVVLIMIVVSVEDFDFSAFPIYLMMCAMLFSNMYILTKYGKERT